MSELTPEELPWHRLVPGNGGCWLAIGSSGGRYGQVRVKGKTYTAHRLFYETLVGPIPEGMELDHKCIIKRCCNPEHLEPVTHSENVLRANRYHRYNYKDTCPRGHSYAESGRDWGSQPRKCAECNRIRCRAYHQRKREQAAAGAAQGTV